MGAWRPWIAALSLGSFAGCAAAPSYGYQYRITQDFTGGEQPETANAEARQLLASAKTVAFYPPDVCVNAELGGGATQSERQLRANCGVLLTTLERAAGRAGYEVLSWQNLRAAGTGKRPIDYARESNVDVLFEINEFDLGGVDDSAIQRSLAFFQRDPDGREQPLAVSPTVINRCAAYAAQRDPVQTAAITGTVDIKTVSVSDGRSRWDYRKTAAQSIGRSYPQIAFPARNEGNKAAGVLGGFGLASIIVAGTLFLVHEATSNDPTTGETQFDPGNWPAYLTAAGVVFIAGAILVQVTGGTTMSPPDAVMCLDTPGVAPPTAQTPAAATANLPMASSVTFQDAAHVDPLVHERERIRDEMIADFIAVLAAAHRNP
jgi:hypothetical protein